MVVRPVDDIRLLVLLTKMPLLGQPVAAAALKMQNHRAVCDNGAISLIRVRTDRD